MIFKKKQSNIHLSDKELLKNLQKRRIPTTKQLRHINKFLNKFEKIIIFVLVTIIMSSLVYLGNYYYQEKSIAIPANGGTLVEGMVGQIIYLNPILASDNTTDSDINNLIYSGLLKYNKDLELVPDLAESYELSEDKKTYTFTLKPDLSFHDGTPLTIDDVIYTYSLIQNPEYKSPSYFNFTGVNIQRIDDRTVSFTLNDIYTPFKHFFTTKIIPRHIWENVAAPNFPLAQHNIKPIGSGPYKFEKFLKDTNGNIISYELSKFKDYHGTKPYINNIELKFFVDIQPALDALINGQITSLGNIPYNEINYIQTENINVNKLDLPQYTALFFNPKQNKNLENKEIRKALTLGVNRKEIITNVFGNNVNLIHGPILPNFLGYDENLPKTEYDLEQAKTLFTENDWTYNQNNYLISKDSSEENNDENNEAEEETSNKNQDVFSLTITLINNEESLNLANQVKDNWKELGIKTELNIVDSNSIKEIIKERNYEIVLYGESLGNDPDLFPFWHSTQITYPGLNLAQFTNKQADTLIEEARQTTDDLSRQSKYAELQKLIIEEYPAIFLYQPKYIYALNKDIKNYQNNKIINYSNRWDDIYHLYIKTKKELNW